MKKEVIFLLFCLKLLFRSSDPYRIEHKKTFLAREGDHVIMELEHHDGLIRIEFRPTPHYLVKNFLSPEMQDGYKYSSNGSVGYFEILNLTKSKADYYDFDYELSNGTGIEYSIDIVIADLQCGLNFPKYYIVDNDCQDVRKDKIDLWCRLVLSKPTNVIFPIEWKTANGNKRRMNVTYTNETYSEAREVDVALKEGDTIETYASTIRCATTFSPQLKIHANNKTSREFTSYRINPMTPDNIEPVTCQANVSQFVHCSYEWRHKDGDVVNKFQGNILHKEDLKKDGTYDCLASCIMKDYSAKQCVLLSDKVIFSTLIRKSEKQSPGILFIVLITVVIFLLVTTVVLLYVFVYRKKLSRKIENKIFQFETEKNQKPQKNKELIIEFIEQLEKSLENDNCTLLNLDGKLSNFCHPLKMYSDSKKFSEKHNLGFLFEKLQNVENKLSNFCAESADETHEKCHKSELRMQVIEIQRDFKREFEQIKLAIQTDDQNVKTHLKILKESNLETVLQNLLNILGGPSTFSINLEKFLDLDDELSQMWNGLKYKQDHFLTLNIFKSQIEQKMKLIKKKLSAIEISELSEDGSEQIELKSETDEGWNKYSNTVSLINGVIRCFDGVSSNQNNFDKISKWSQDFEKLYKNFETVLNNQTGFNRFRNYKKLVQIIKKLKSTFLSFQNEFNQKPKAATLMHLQVEIETKLTSLASVLKSFHEEVQTTSANKKEPTVEDSHIETRRDLLKQLSPCLEKFQEYFEKPTIIQINIEHNFDDKFKKYWKKVEIIPQDPSKLSLLRKKAEKYKISKKDKECNILSHASFLEAIVSGFDRSCVFKISFEDIKKLKIKISNFQNIGRIQDFENYSKNLTSLRDYLIRFANLHKDYPSYDEDRQLKVYVELKKKKEALEQVLKDFDKDLRFTFLKLIEPKSFKIESLIFILRKSENMTINLKSNLKKVEYFRLLWGELTDLRSFLRTFQDGFVDLTSVFIIFEECIEMDEDLLKFWEGLHKDFSNVSIYKALLALRSEIQKKKENLKRRRKQKVQMILKRHGGKALVDTVGRESSEDLSEVIDQMSSQKGSDPLNPQRSYVADKPLTEDNIINGKSSDLLSNLTSLKTKYSRKVTTRKLDPSCKDLNDMNRLSESSEISNDLDPLFFIDHLLKGFRPHQYVIVDSEALLTFHDRSLRFKTKLEDYQKCCDDVPNFKEFLEKLSDFIGEIHKYENKFVNKEKNNENVESDEDSDDDIPLKMSTLDKLIQMKKKYERKNFRFKSVHWKLENKRKQLEEVFDAFKVSLEKKLPKLNKTNMKNASLLIKNYSQKYELNSDNLKDLSTDLSAFSTALKEFQNVIKGPTLLLIDLDKCLNLNNEFLKIWHDSVHSKYISKRSTLEFCNKLRGSIISSMESISISDISSLDID